MRKILERMEKMKREDLNEPDGNHESALESTYRLTF